MEKEATLEKQKSTKGFNSEKEESNQPKSSNQASSTSIEIPVCAREEWQNSFQFLLATVGLAVGLGNIWRFPAVAYENGGSAFLIPYLVCSLLFGLPMIYAEFAIGQYCRSGPSMAFFHYAPALQGIGWTAGILSASICIYYTGIISWTCIYLFFILTGQIEKTTSCNNWWNTQYCVDSNVNSACMDNNNNSTMCSFLMSGSEEFFTYFILRRSSGIEDFGSINWPVFLALTSLWMLIGFILVKGIKFMGRLAYFTTIFPYIVLIVLFIRGVTLDGAAEGIQFFLGAPDFDKVFMIQTWTNAVKQICFSLSVGYGGLITLSSYNKFSNNCFRDAVIVISCDTLMSIVGGTAVFSTLGFLAKQLNKSVEDVVQSGASLAFIVYPQAIFSMPCSSLLAGLFFLMLFSLGISTEVALLQVLCTCIYDRFKSTQHQKWKVVGSLLSIYYLLSIVLASGAGWYWFNLYDSYTGTTTACISTFLELVIIAWLYGVNNFMKDIQEMLGRPNVGLLSKIFGTQSIMFQICWKYISPILTLIIMLGTIVRERMIDVFQEKIYIFPIWAEIVGWFLNLCPLIALPVFFVVNIMQFRKNVRNSFHLQPSLRSYARVHSVSTQKTTK